MCDFGVAGVDFSSLRARRRRCRPATSSLRPSTATPTCCSTTAPDQPPPVASHPPPVRACPVPCLPVVCGVAATKPLPPRTSPTSPIQEDREKERTREAIENCTSPTRPIQQPPEAAAYPRHSLPSESTVRVYRPGRSAVPRPWPAFALITAAPPAPPESAACPVRVSTAAPVQSARPGPESDRCAGLCYCCA